MNTNINPNTNIDPRDTNGNPLIVGNHYHFRFRNRDLLKEPDPNQIENSNLSQHPSQFVVKTEEEIVAFENINFELYHIWPEEQEDIVYLYFSGRDENDENNIDIDLSEWEPEWADYVPSNVISTPVRPKRSERIPTPKTTRKFDAKGDVLPLETPTVVKRTRLFYGGKRRRKKTRKKKRRRKTRRKKTRKKKRRRKTRRKKTRKKKRRRKTSRKKTRKKRGGNGDDMPGIEMKEFNKKYPQNQPPQNQPIPLHQRLNKKGKNTWKTLEGFFGLTPSKQLQEDYWEKHDKKVAKSILDKQFQK